MEDKILAKETIAGNASARKQIVSLVDPVINKQTRMFCRRFCKENRVISQCTLFKEWQSSNREQPLCEWGNGSYAWMLEDLTKSERLAKYEGKEGATLKDYWYVIATSQPFYERWKDWRFGRRERAPTYIVSLDPQANRVFLLLRHRYEIPDIAQRLNRNETEIIQLVQLIMAELLDRNKLHLLEAPHNISLSGTTSDDSESEYFETDLESWDVPPEHLQDIEKLRVKWKKLTPQEQFLLQAMLIDELDANEVLSALESADIRIIPDVEPKDVNRQQLYYVRRRAVAKLAGLIND